MSERAGYLALETGECYAGLFAGRAPAVGEVVFNTSHSGYEEMATDPSYFSQILVCTAPMQGNYGSSKEAWESRRLWIEGYVCLELQNTPRDSSWKNTLAQNNVPLLHEVDTRRLVLRLREGGTPWGALVETHSQEEALHLAKKLIAEKKSQPQDWAFAVTRTSVELLQGLKPSGPRLAVLDFGCKENTLMELRKRSSEVAVFPSRTPAEEIRKYNPQGLLLSNGPGDPVNVEVACETVQALLGWRPIFGICMGHQILALALGARTYRLRFGHRGSNHPIRDDLLRRIYVTSQNHGYAVSEKGWPSDLEVTHVNLNDQSIAGIFARGKKALSVQFHPESCPGPHDSVALFDYFLGMVQ